jgi:NAD+ kinase
LDLTHGFFSEGDYIKVTASKYPFPTVCADKQATDWFHAISRTLKWNERERQKSFVMVEEEPVKKTNKSRRRSRSATPGAGVKTEMQQSEESGEDQEEIEVSDEEDEDDKFDIDDLSSSNTEGKPCGVESKDAGNQIAKDLAQARAEVAADALSRGNPFISRTPFSKSGIDSGVDSPDRFMGPYPHPPRLSPRHVSFASNLSSRVSTSSEALSTPGEHEVKDLARSRFSGPEGKIVKDLSEGSPKIIAFPEQERPGQPHHHHRGRSREGHPVRQELASSHRAFALWGRDESDSNTSGSDS